MAASRTRASVLSPTARAVLWSGWVVLGLLLLPIGDGPTYLAAVTASALAVAMVPGAVTWHGDGRDSQDLLVILGLYLAVVALNRAAFVGFTVEHVTGLFLCFAAALVLGTVAPVVYTVGVRHRSFDDLGLGRDNLGSAAGFALVFATVQFVLTLWGYDLPTAVDWVPLLVMSLVVGIFESVFFRGFIQTRLERQFGDVPGVAAAALLYGVYHVGFGMSGDEILFLTGLGIVYAVAFAVARNLIVLWPLLTPIGSFYASLEAGDIDLPWASIAGFADVVAVMLLGGWLTWRHQHLAGGTRKVGTMTDPEAEAERERIETRAEDLLPEEESAGSEDPHAQAEAILADSDERTQDPEGTGETETPTQA